MPTSTTGRCAYSPTGADWAGPDKQGKCLCRLREGTVARDLRAREGAESAAGKMAAAKALDEVTGEIADAAYTPHTGLGPGLLDSVYETVLARGLRRH